MPVIVILPIPRAAHRVLPPPLRTSIPQNPSHCLPISEGLECGPLYSTSGESLLWELLKVKSTMIHKIAYREWCSSPSSKPWAHRWRTTNVCHAWPVRRQTYGFGFVCWLHFSFLFVLLVPVARHHRPLAGSKLYCLMTGTCVLTTCPGLHSTAGRLRFKPATYWSQVRHHTAMPPTHYWSENFSTLNACPGQEPASYWKHCYTWHCWHLFGCLRALSINIGVCMCVCSGHEGLFKCGEWRVWTGAYQNGLHSWDVCSATVKWHGNVLTSTAGLLVNICTKCRGALTSMCRSKIYGRDGCHDIQSSLWMSFGGWVSILFIDWDLVCILPTEILQNFTLHFSSCWSVFIG